METRNVILLIWDTEENFRLESTQRNLGKELQSQKDLVFKEIKRFNSREQFIEIWEKISIDEKLVFACHVMCQDLSLLKEFTNTRIQEDFSIPAVFYVSSDAVKAFQKWDESHKDSERFIYYDTLINNIKSGTISTFTKGMVSNQGARRHFPIIDYAIITALFDDEFEALKNIFSFPEEEEIHIGEKTYYIGYLKSNSEIKVVAGVPFNTGMVDSSIMATQMIEIFQPKYILMSGVCGGKRTACNLGDIIVAKNVYTFQKGKVSDIDDVKTNGLYDKQGNVVDYDKLYDKSGNQIGISVERFEIEHDSMISLEHFVDSFNKHKRKIATSINNEIEESGFIELGYKLKIYHEPMACSTMVINKEGFFEDTLKTIDRKTIAVEMESYGVARACKYANEGKTKPIIFKSVMDFTYNKEDTKDKINYKKLAANTSAQFLKYLFEYNVI